MGLSSGTVTLLTEQKKKLVEHFFWNNIFQSYLSLRDKIPYTSVVVTVNVTDTGQIS